MVMSSRLMLLPFPTRLLSRFSPAHTRCDIPEICAFHRYKCEAFSVTLGRNQGVVCDRGFAKPRWRKEVRVSAWNAAQKFRLSAASSSAMGGHRCGPPPLYRQNVGICLINDKNEVFVALRIDVPGAWQMPQGGIDEGEDPQAAAVRELREETGVTSAEYLGEVPEWLTYDFPPDVKTKLTALWGTEWNGQAQKWFLFRFFGNEREINLQGDGSERPEFSEWKWVPVEEVVKNAVDFKKSVYERAFKHLVTLMK